MKLAILYQQSEPPAKDGIRKPMKPGGYSDSGADIAYCLKSDGEEVITPAENPDVYRDTDWVFPDTKEGIELAISLGADTLWLNTVLFATHPITLYKGIDVVGQEPSCAEKLDDKFGTNKFLKDRNLSVIDEVRIGKDDLYEGLYPCVIKPIRGRGSQGVVKCDTTEDFRRVRDDELKKKIYGDTLMAEEFLCGREITISVFPDGKTLPTVERVAHKNGIAPYNGDVPVTQNSFAIKDDTKELVKIKEDCVAASQALKIKGLVRIDCREDKNGVFKIFDFNAKPNITGGVRPHRKNQDCLTMIAARAAGLTYRDLLLKMLGTAWTV